MIMFPISVFLLNQCLHFYVALNKAMVLYYFSMIVFYEVDF